MFLLLLAMFSVSTSPIIARYLENVPAVAISFWRMGFGAIILWLISLIQKQTPLKNNNLKRTLIAGIFLGIHFALFFGAIKLTTIANATFLGTLAPVITFIIEKYILKRDYTYTLIWGLRLAVFGAVIIVSESFNFSSSLTIGNLLAVACSVCLGLAIIISESVRQKIGTINYSRTLFSSAAGTLFVIAIIMKIDILGYSYFEYGGLLLLGIIPTILGHGSMYYAIRYVSPTIVASIPMGEPVLASLLAWFLFQEIIGLGTIIGGSITLIGLVLLVQKNK
jgi:drug/metabolite transporter (DMT)-like permease